MLRTGHRGAPGRARRNVLLFGLAVAALAALIGLAAFARRRAKPIMPPESEEIADKRESPDNAFFTLQEAWRLLPPWPPEPAFVNADGKPIPREIHSPEPRSLGKLLDIHRPDDDPVLAEFFGKFSPLAAKLREATNKPFFLFPEIGTPKHNSCGATADYTARFLTAAMIHRARYADNDEEALECLAVVLRVGDMLAQDGGIQDYRVAASTQARVLRYVADAAVHVESPVLLRAMLQQVRAVSNHDRTGRPYVECSWRLLDSWAAEGFRDPHWESMHTVNAMVYSWLFKRHVRFIAANREAIAAAAELPYAEFVDHEKSDPIFRQSPRHLHFGGFGEIRTLVKTRAQLRTAIAGASIALALELHHRAHGCYPETLDALTPTYLDAVPVDGYDGNPFIYRLEGEDYWLYDATCRTDKEHLMREAAFHSPGT